MTPLSVIPAPKSGQHPSAGSANPIGSVRVGTVPSGSYSRSDPTQEQQYDEDDNDDTDDAHPTVTEAVTIAAESAAEPTEQEDDEDNDEYESE
jgi:hypothetical protein